METSYGKDFHISSKVQTLLNARVAGLRHGRKRKGNYLLVRVIKRVMGRPVMLHGRCKRTIAGVCKSSQPKRKMPDCFNQDYRGSSSLTGKKHHARLQAMNAEKASFIRLAVFCISPTYRCRREDFAEFGVNVLLRQQAIASPLHVPAIQKLMKIQFYCVNIRSTEETRHGDDKGYSVYNQFNENKTAL